MAKRMVINRKVNRRVKIGIKVKPNATGWKSSPPPIHRRVKRTQALRTFKKQ